MQDAKPINAGIAVCVKLLFPRHAWAGFCFFVFLKRAVGEFAYPPTLWAAGLPAGAAKLRSSFVATRAILL